MDTVELVGQFAWGKPQATAILKACVDDFIVEEQLSFEPAGIGEHIYCYIEKRGLNTVDVATALARVCNVAPRDVSYAGLKDKQAVTRQWFSIYLPGKVDPPLKQLETELLVFKRIERSDKKLRRGALRGNQFTLCLRGCEGELDSVITKLDHIRRSGFANYFTQQRFGIDGRNLRLAQRLLVDGKKIKNRLERSMAFSAARSYLFNRILSYRIEQNCWRTALAGDVMNLHGSNSVFAIDAVDEAIITRVEAHDIFPATVLWGMGRGESRLAAKALEALVLAEFAPWCEGLVNKKLTLAYRPMVCMPEGLNARFQGNDLHLSFFLRGGSYATALVRDLCFLR